MEAKLTTPVKPKLSVVIPTMDRHALLAETLATIASQLSPATELVVLDSSKDQQPVKEMVQKAGGRYYGKIPAGLIRLIWMWLTWLKGNMCGFLATTI